MPSAAKLAAKFSFCRHRSGEKKKSPTISSFSITTLASSSKRSTPRTNSGDRSMEIFLFLLAPFVASLILTCIHAYLGVHVVERGVIFVDLALAQIAALGATVAIVVGMDPHGRGSYWISLAFTFLGAAIFAFARSSRGHIPQEAFIGIAYAVASATAILFMSKATGETEHLKDMLVGNILAVSWPEVGKTAFLYGAIGIFHILFRKKFLAISMNHQKAEQSGIRVRFWDFLFYASFGFVVTSSVAIAGRSVEEEIPEAHADTRLLRFLV